MACLARKSLPVCSASLEVNTKEKIYKKQISRYNLRSRELGVVGNFLCFLVCQFLVTQRVSLSPPYKRKQNIFIHFVLKMLFSFRSLTLEIMYKIMNITTLLWQNFSSIFRESQAICHRTHLKLLFIECKITTILLKSFVIFRQKIVYFRQNTTLCDEMGNFCISLLNKQKADYQTPKLEAASSLLIKADVSADSTLESAFTLCTPFNLQPGISAVRTAKNL